MAACLTCKAFSLFYASNYINMASEIWTLMNPSGIILRDVKWNKKLKPKGHGSTLEETRPDCLIYSIVTATE